jgi:hypothetical protein
MTATASGKDLLIELLPDFNCVLLMPVCFHFKVSRMSSLVTCLVDNVVRDTKVYFFSGVSSARWGNVNVDPTNAGPLFLDLPLQSLSRFGKGQGQVCCTDVVRHTVLFYCFRFLCTAPMRVGVLSSNPLNRQLSDN